MRRYIGCAIIFIIVITLLIWACNTYIKPILPKTISDTVISVFVLMMTLMGVLSNFKDVVEFIHSTFGKSEKSSEESPEEKRRNRKTMLQRVESYWITGVLDQSLQGAILLEIEKEYHPKAVNFPWAIEKQVNQSISTEKNIRDIFDEANGELLILGEPGSGKTTLLLILASKLIARAKREEIYPIPIILNLSSWGGNQKPLQEWLVEELRTKYYIPNHLGKSWLSTNSLCLLFDGLDEVKRDARGTCIEAINTFRRENGLTHIAVCSRKVEYEQTGTNLCLDKAIMLLPLTRDQIDQYLDGTGLELLAVRQTLKNDMELQEIAQSPLMLSIMVLAYRGKSIQELEFFGSIEDRRKHIFTNYVQQMFERKSENTHLNQKQMIHRLSWLANIMKMHSLSILMVEGIQPNWFNKKKFKLIFGLIGALVFGYVGGLIVCSIYGFSSGLVASISCGAIGGFLSWRSGEKIALTERLTINWGKIIVMVILGMVLGLVVGLSIGPIIGVLLGIITGVIAGFIFTPTANIKRDNSREDDDIGPIMMCGTLIFVYSSCIIGVLSLGLIGGSNSGLFHGPNEGLIAGIVGGLILGAVIGFFIGVISWRGSGFHYGLMFGLGFFALFGIVFGIIGGLIGFFIGWLNGISITGSFGRLGSSLVIGLLGGLLFGLFGVGGLKTHTFEGKTKPNQGIWLSLRNATVIILLGILICVLVGTLVGKLTSGAFVGIIVGFLFSLNYGLSSFTKHFLLRFILLCNNKIPWNMVHFLDDAADLIFLRKVGSGYIFLHPMLSDYFAELEE